MRTIFLIFTIITQIACLQLNDPCVNRGKSGVCKKLRECQSAQNDYNLNGLEFIRCGGYVGDHLIVCCGIEQTTTEEYRIDHDLEKLSISERSE